MPLSEEPTIIVDADNSSGSINLAKPEEKNKSFVWNYFRKTLDKKKVECSLCGK